MHILGRGVTCLGLVWQLNDIETSLMKEQHTNARDAHIHTHAYKCRHTISYSLIILFHLKFASKQMKNLKQRL